MKLSVTHETQYRYSTPVLLSQQLLHLSPRALAWQRCDKHETSVEPTANEMTQRQDYYGNPTASLVIAVPHQTLTARAASAATVEPRAHAARAAPHTAWVPVPARLSGLYPPP